MLRAPRAVLNVSAGQIVPTECAVEMTTYRKSDIFSAKVALDGTPGIDEFFWSALTDVSMEIQAATDINTSGFVSLFTGKIDHVDINFQNRTCFISGRDLTADLHETKTSENFTNQNTAQIVKTIASRIGLTANVTVPSGDKVGLIYNQDYNRITDQDVLFNVLTRLAQRSGCVFFVQGTTLFFQPANMSGGIFTVTYQAPTADSIASGNWITLSAKRNYVIGKNVSVTTSSWQLKQKKVVNAKYQANGSVSGTLAHTYRAPNMTQQQAGVFSQNQIEEILSREKILEIDMPGDVTLTPERQIELVGTGTAFDQVYALSRVSHRFEQAGGYRMQVSTRNKDKGRTATQRAIGTHS